MGKRSHPFTLFEVLIVMLLIGVVTGTCVFQIPKAFKTESFSQCKERLIDKLLLAQELMLDYSTDVTLTLIQKDKGILCVFESDSRIPLKVIHRLNRDPLLKGIKQIRWNNDERKFLPLSFYASGGLTPHGTLNLKGEKTCTLFLSGFPGRILEQPKSYSYEPKAPYPQEVLSPT